MFSYFHGKHSIYSLRCKKNMSTRATAIPSRQHGIAIAVDQLIYRLCRHWLLGISVLLGLYVGLPVLAPVLMQLGWHRGANVIYAIYATQCHQLPERSFFLFGPKLMYSLAEIQAVWIKTNNPLLLRQFIGAGPMGWKVAWSDRMMSMYGGMLLSIILWSPFRRRAKPLPWWGLVLLTLPMVLDGGTHAISDLAGIGQGFRDSNAWLAALTSNALPATFYAGDAIGSFNSSMRLITGLLFSLGGVWFVFPYLQQSFAATVYNLEDKFNRANRAL